MSGSPSDITEFRTLVESYKKPKSLIIRAIRLLLRQQFLFADDRGCRDLYEIITDYDCTGFFLAYFACAGFTLIVDRQRRVVALMPPDEDSEVDAPSMRIDETIILLLCKARFDQAILQSAKLEDGNAPWHTDALYEQWRTTTGREPPGKTRVVDLLRQLKARNLIAGTIPPILSDGIEFAVRPSIALAVTVDVAQTLTAYALSRQASQSGLESEDDRGDQ